MPRETQSGSSHTDDSGKRATNSAPSANGIFRRDGEYWTVGYRNRPFQLKDSKDSPTSRICYGIPELSFTRSI
jgi:hypothetical protein